MKTRCLIVTAILVASLSGCDSDSPTSSSTTTDTTADSVSSCNAATHTCVTVGVYLLSDGVYTDTNKDLIYSVGAKCETWSRTASGDNHDSASHEHYNAQDASTYDGVTITWFEHGPELSQSAIGTTCAAGTSGVQKIANTNGYTPDKNFYVRVKGVSQ